MDAEIGAREGRLWVRRPLELPGLEAFDDDIVRRSRRIDLSSLKPVGHQDVVAAPERFFAPLVDPLSYAMDSISVQVRASVRSHWEAEGLALLLQRKDQFLDPASFRATLLQLNRHQTLRASTWRTKPIGISPDARGNHIIFPDMPDVPGQLVKLLLMLKSEEQPPIIRAAQALAIIVNAHPFIDGNGRVSRVVFNFVLRQAGMPAGVYIPLYELMRRARGGYEIALRRAEIRAEWNPLITFFIRLLACHQRIAGIGLFRNGPASPTRRPTAIRYRTGPGDTRLGEKM